MGLGSALGRPGGQPKVQGEAGKGAQHRGQERAGVGGRMLTAGAPPRAFLVGPTAIGENTECQVYSSHPAQLCHRLLCDSGDTSESQIPPHKISGLGEIAQ